MDAGSLTAEWTRAVINVDLNRVQELYQSNPELLWTPLEKESTNIETDYAHLLAQLEQVQVLGNNLAHLTAIPFTLLDHLETDDEEAMPLSVAQQKRARLLYFLIEVRLLADSCLVLGQAIPLPPFFHARYPVIKFILMSRMQMRTT